MGVCVCVALVFAGALTQNVMLQIEVRSDANRSESPTNHIYGVLLKEVLVLAPHRVSYVFSHAINFDIDIWMRIR